MLKKTVLAVAVFFLSLGVTQASPLMDYGQGKVAVDLVYRFNTDASGAWRDDNSYSDMLFTSQSYNESSTFSLDGKNNLEWGITFGLGNNFAAQYRQYSPKSENFWNLLYENYYDSYYPEYSPYVVAKVRANEYNLLYKAGKNITVFTGLVKATASLDGNYSYCPLHLTGERTAPGKKIWQLGATGVTQIADKTTLYGTLAGGKDYSNWEVGVAYKLGKNMEWDVSYRSVKFKDLNGLQSLGHYGDVVFKDWEFKGLGTGITVKF
ncbi:MAG: hypothetical protein N2491_09235 [Negativicutes bacterium]|nr:hypothetical protein [Negativicutes bacterium]